MYNASINEQQLSGSIQMLLIKSIIFFPFFVVFVERVWQQQCLNTLVSICKHGHKHIGEMKRKKREWQREKKKDVFRFHIALTPTGLKMWTNTATQTGIVPFTVTAADPTHSPSSRETTWVMLLLMKADLVNPICGLNRSHQLKMLQRCNSPQTHVVFATHPCNNCEEYCSLNSEQRSEKCFLFICHIFSFTSDTH